MDKRAMQYPPASSAVWGVPPAVDELILRALEPRPERRLESPSEFIAKLEAAVGGFRPAVGANSPAANS